MIKYQTLTEMLDHHSRGQLAIGYLEGENAEKTLPLSQLRRRALGILHHLQRLGAQPGDLLILLRPRVTTIEEPAPGYVETHGSPWDYDRRVPILFWRPDAGGQERYLPIRTVDIAPTLAGVLGLEVPADLDGRCLDLGLFDVPACAPGR